jgi:hypothetical protein
MRSCRSVIALATLMALNPRASDAAQILQPALPFELDGGVMTAPAAADTRAPGMAAARVRVELPAFVAAMNVSTPLASRQGFQPATLGVGGVLTAPLIHAAPDAIAVNGLLSVRYATGTGRGGAVARVEVGEATGLWIGARLGDARVDSVAATYRAPEPPLGLPFTPFPTGGPTGIGTGVWHREGALIVGASMTTGWTRYASNVVTMHPGVGTDSVVQPATADTSEVTHYGTMRLSDLWASWTIGRLGLDVAGGTRAGAHLATVGWVSGTVTWRVVPVVALALTAGNRGSAVYGPLADRGTRGYLAAGLQLSSWTWSQPPGALASGVRAAGYRIVTAPNGDHLLIVLAPFAQRLDVRGDLTAWRDLPCAPLTGGRWQCPPALPTGIHHVSVRANNGRWEPLPGAAIAVSDYGDTVGVIIIS